jgi:hypothetical protein
MITINLADASESTVVTAENLHDEFLNAKTPAQRFKVFLRTLDWAVTSTVNASHARNRGTAL